MNDISSSEMGIDVSQPESSGGITRRKLIPLLGIPAIATSCGLPRLRSDTTDLPDSDGQSLPEGSEAKEVLQYSPTEFGFTQHLTVEEGTDDNQNAELFRLSVDRLAEADQTWLRTHIHEGEVVEVDGEGNLTWNTENLEKYKENIQYAKDKGLKLCLIGHAPGLKDMDDAMHLKVTEEFFRRMGHEFNGLADSWQVFNEPAMHNIRDYDDVRGATELNFMSRRPKLGPTINEVRAASRAVKEANPDVDVAVNFAAGHFSQNMRTMENMYSVGFYFFDKLGDAIDEIQLDVYPHPSQMDLLQEHVKKFKERFPDKKVSFGEIGISTVQVTPEQQIEAISLMMDAAQSGEVPADKAIVFSLTNRGSVTHDGWHRNLGVLDESGAPKAGEALWEELASHMQPPEDDDESMNNSTDIAHLVA